MAITTFDENMDIISALDNEPNDVGGLTAAQLKAKFDEAGTKLKTYINTVLIPLLEAATAAESIGAELRDGTDSNVAGALVQLRNEIDNIVEHGGEGDMLKSIYDPTNQATDVFAYADAKITIKTVTLPANGWVEEEFIHLGSVAVSGLLSTDFIVVEPVYNSRAEYADCGVVCCEQADGWLDFRAVSNPSNDLTVKIAILK